MSGTGAPAERVRTPRPAVAPEPAEPDWRRYLAALRRHYRVVLGVALVGTAAGAVGGQRLVGPRYAATARLWIGAGQATQGARGTDGGPAAERLLDVGGWVDLVKSHAVLDSVVRGLGLYLTLEDAADSAALGDVGVADVVRPGRYRFSVGPAERPGFALTGPEGEVVHGAFGDSAGAALGLKWMPRPEAFRPGQTVRFTITAPSDAAEELAGQLQVETDPDATRGGLNPDAAFLRVTLEGRDPERTSAIVNAVARRVVIVAGDLRRRKVSELTAILGQQLQHAESTLTRSETDLKAFQVRTAGVLPLAEAPPSPTYTRTVEVRTESDQIRRDRAAIELLLPEASDSGPAVDVLAAIPGVQRAPELSQALKELTDKRAQLRALRSAYTDASLPVLQLQDAVSTLEQRTIPALLRELLRGLAAQQQSLDQQADSLARYLRTIPALALEQARLEREVTIANQLFTTMQQRYHEARLVEVSSLPDVQVLDAAPQPHQPVTRLGPFLAVLSLLLSLGAGGVAAVVMDHSDTRLHDPAAVSHGMGLRILGAVPHLSRSGKRRDQETAAIEALRAIRVRLEQICAGEVPLAVTVTSPGIGEGKSLVAANLAAAFAQAGLRTLLVDGDVRRGILHRHLGARRRPGLTDYLDGQASLERVLQPTRYPLLTFVGSGLRSHAAPELLGSAAMAGLASVRGSYDAVVVDSAPLSAGADAWVLGAATGNLLLVFRAEATDLQLAARTLEALGETPTRVVGAVLNDVRRNGAYRYYAYYAPGYETQGEGDRAAPRALLGAPDA